MRHPGQVRAPAVCRAQLDLWIVSELVHDTFHDRVKQFVAVRHVPVQRHRADSQPGRHRAHGRGPDALLVHQFQRGRDDPVQRQTPAGRLRRPGLVCAFVTETSPQDDGCAQRPARSGPSAGCSPADHLKVCGLYKSACVCSPPGWPARRPQAHMAGEESAIAAFCAECSSCMGKAGVELATAVLVLRGVRTGRLPTAPPGLARCLSPSFAASGRHAVLKRVPPQLDGRPQRRGRVRVRR